MRIVEFLNARLDEDETTVRRMRHHDPDEGGYYSCPEARDEPLGDLPGGPGTCDCRLAERQERALREIDAKRRLVAICDGAAWAETGRAVLAMDVLKELAAVYSGHPDHAERWTP